MEIFPIKPENFGIEISDSAVKIVQLKPNGKFFDIKSWGEEKITPGIVKGGEIKDQSLLIRAIKKAVKEVKGEGIKTRHVVASLPESKAFLRTIRMPQMTKEELESAVPFEAEHYIPLSIEEVYLDFQIAETKGLSQRVLIVAFPKPVVDSYLEVLRRADLFPVAFEPESIALCRVLAGKAVPFPVAIFDIGESKANFVIFSRGTVRFSSSFSVVQQDPSLLADQIKKYVDYYHSHYSAEKRIGKILLSGEKKGLGGLTGVFSKSLEIKTETADPLVNILSGKNKSPIPSSEVLGFSTVLGLALRGVKND